MVNVTMTQSKVFRAASSGDGGFLEPMGHFVIRENYRSIFGGSPFDPEATELSQRLSPTFRAQQAAAPVLQQVARGTASPLPFHVSLREANAPRAFAYLPCATPTSHPPPHPPNNPQRPA